MKIKKILRILLVVGLGLLALGLLFPAVTANGVSVMNYGQVIFGILTGGAVIYFIVLPFAGLLAFSERKALIRAGQALGLAIAVINLYAFALVIENFLDPDIAGANIGGLGLAISFVGAHIVLVIIILDIIFELVGLKVVEAHNAQEILFWKDLLDREIINKEEFEDKKREILCLVKKTPAVKKEKAVKKQVVEDKKEETE
jgi:hypothetical protein